MKVLFITAHESPSSFSAALYNRALSYYEKKGHHVVISDLYGLGFHAVAEKWDFKVSGGPNESYVLEQARAASSESGFAEDIKAEVLKVRDADLIIFSFPIWWSAPPAILKGWFDKVFAMGITWDASHRYGSGLLRGKRALVICSAGDSEQDYSARGLHGASLEQHLYPLLHSTLAHSGLDVLKPFFAMNLARIAADDRYQILDDLEGHLSAIDQKPVFIYQH